MARAGVDIRVTRGEDGTIRITADPVVGPVVGPVVSPAGDGSDVAALDPGFTGAVLDVAGAVLVWPDLGDPGLPVAEVHDVGRAQQWLWAVYGERAAAAVRACAAGESADVRVAADVTALAGAAARLGFGHWASRWWPASYADGIPALEPDVLGLELAALTHRCQQLFDDCGDQPDDCVAELIADHQAALDPLIQWWRTALPPADMGPGVDTGAGTGADTGTGTARHLESVLRLIDDAADSAGLDGPALRRLRSCLERELDLDRGRGRGRGREDLDLDRGREDLDLDRGRDDLDLDLDQRRPTGTPTGPGTPLDPVALFAPHTGYALAAGEPLVAGGRVIARGAGTNDWRRYPPGFVDAAETAVSWTARALGGRRQIEVEVVAHIAAPVGGAPLVAEVRVNGGPPDRVPLTRQDDMWTGRADLDLRLPAAGAKPLFEVIVLLPGFDPGPGPEAHADRDAIRALARRRLATAAPRPADDAAPHDALPHDASPHHSLPHNTAPHEATSGLFLAEIVAAATGEDY